jgi:hypothetical protein
MEGTMKIERMQYHDALYSQGNVRKATKKKKGREESYSVDPESDKQKQHSEQQEQQQAKQDEPAETVVAQQLKSDKGGLNIIV